MKRHVISPWHILLVLTTLVGCNGDTEANKLKSGANMKQLAIAITTYQQMNKKWPDSFDDIASFTEGKEGLAYLLKNPVTGDDPGYEYVKPTADKVTRETVLIYQLRDGKRDATLALAYGDASVRQPGK